MCVEKISLIVKNSLNIQNYKYTYIQRYGGNINSNIQIY